MSGPPKVTVSAKDARGLATLQARIDRAEAQAEQARQEWAKLVRSIGVAAVARELGISRQALTERVAIIERRR